MEGPRVPQPMSAGDTHVQGAGHVGPFSDKSFYTARMSPLGSGGSSKASKIQGKNSKIYKEQIDKLPESMFHSDLLKEEVK